MHFKERAKEDNKNQAKTVYTLGKGGSGLEHHNDELWNFEWEVWRGLMELLDIKKIRTTPLHPTIQLRDINNNYLSFCRNHHDWDKLVSLFCLIIWRDTLHSHNYVNQKRYETNYQSKKNCPNYVRDLRERQEKFHNFTKNNVQLSSNRMKKSRQTDFKEGDTM